jgi:hypothetical protein
MTERIDLPEPEKKIIAELKKRLAALSENSAEHAALKAIIDCKENYVL